MLVRRLSLLAFTLAVAAASNTTHAGALDSFEALDQSDFRTLTENLAAATHYRGITPAEPLGIIGFDVGVSLTATEINEEVLDLASEGDFELSQILLPRVHAHKGLPFGFDIGAFASAVPDTEIKLLGAEIRKAIFEGSAATPAVGIRAGFSTLQGLDQLSLQSLSVDLSISKGVLMLTPYAGVGYIVTKAEASEEFGFDEESVNQQKVYAGININFGLNFTLEADRTGDYTSYSAKAGIRF